MLGVTAPGKAFYGVPGVCTVSLAKLHAILEKSYLSRDFLSSHDRTWQQVLRTKHCNVQTIWSPRLVKQ